MSRPKSPSDRNTTDGDGQRQKGRRSRALREEEARLWLEVTKSLKPLRRRDEKAAAAAAKLNLPENWSETSAATPSAAAPPAAAGTSADAAKRPVPRHGKGSHDTLPVQRRIPDLAGFTRRDMRQITTGRQSIEARLDLHGLRQGEAHVALRGFLAGCQDQGLKHVLVITGKGNSYNREEALFGRDEPGVLRRLVPLWLSEPGLRAIVAGFTEAPLRHGGAGALYVRLRARKSG